MAPHMASFVREQAPALVPGLHCHRDEEGATAAGARDPLLLQLERGSPVAPTAWLPDPPVRRLGLARMPSEPTPFEVHESGALLHGTKADLKVGDLLEPGRRSNFAEGRTMNLSLIHI